MYRLSIWLIVIVSCCTLAQFLQLPAGSGSVGHELAAAATELRPEGAVGDGRADDTAAIQRAVNSSAGGVWLPRGRYRITKTITIDLNRVGPTSIRGDGTATIVMEGPGPALRFIGTHEGTADPATVQDEVWKNQRAPMVDAIEIVGEHAHADGIEITGTMQMILSRVVIRQVGTGIHLVKRNRNLVVAECQIYENRGIGIYYDHVNLHQSNICNSHISYNAGGGVVIRGGDVRNVHIGTCDIEGNMGGPESAPTANVLLDSTGGSIGEVAIVGCTIQHAHEAPDSANIRVNGQSTARPFTDELRHGNVTIADNVLSDVQVNIDLKNTRGVTISGNTMWKGYTHNLRLSHCDHVVVQGNVCDRNPRYHYGDGAEARLGMEFVDCSDCTIAANHIFGTGDQNAAMLVRRCRGFNVVGCTISEPKNDGLVFEDVVNSRVSDCLIGNRRQSQWAGCSLRVVRGRGNMIVNNLLGNQPKIDSANSHVAGNVVSSQAE